MRLYFAGAEISSHRKVLREVGAKSASLSFMGLRRRLKHPDRWLMEEKFPAEMGLLLDSGAYTVNNNAMDYTQGQLKEIAEAYGDFVALNIDRVEAFIEFDAMALGREWIEEQRAIYASISPEKFMPVWHPEWGLNYLQEMAETYQRIGIPAVDIAGRNLTPALNRIADSGVSIHGVAMTHMDDMRAIRWGSVSSTSWIAPQQYGETHVWTGRELKRYPKKMKDNARKRYRTLFGREGFDVDKIEADDSTELLRLSVWSWEKFVDDIENKSQRGADGPGLSLVPADDGFAEDEGGEVGPSTDETRNEGAARTPVRIRPTIALPVLHEVTRTVKDDDSGEESEVKEYKVRSQSERQCTTCYLANKCPAYEPGSNCAFDIPLQVRTTQEFRDSVNALIEMQQQRVLFMRFAEEIEGGYADPNLSAEMDRLAKMFKIKSDMEAEGFTFKMEAKMTGPGTGEPGRIGRLFGDVASQRAQALESPMRVEQIEEIVDGEIDG